MDSLNSLLRLSRVSPSGPYFLDVLPAMGAALSSHFSQPVLLPSGLPRANVPLSLGNPNPFYKTHLPLTSSPTGSVELNTPWQ